MAEAVIPGVVMQHLRHLKKKMTRDVMMSCNGEQQHNPIIVLKSDTEEERLIRQAEVKSCLTILVVTTGLILLIVHAWTEM